MIAILSSNYRETMNWVQQTFNIKLMRHSDWSFVTEDGREYMIITRPEQVGKLRFEEYLRAPDFFTLEDVVKAQVR